MLQTEWRSSDVQEVGVFVQFENGKSPCGRKAHPRVFPRTIRSGGVEMNSSREGPFAKVSLKLDLEVEGPVEGVAVARERT
jgi:hypothetical protein